MWQYPVALVVLFGELASSAPARDAGSRAQERTIAALPRSLWFLLPPREPQPRGKELGLVVVLPGGTGTRDFLGFVAGGLLAQAPADCVGVLVPATRWTDDQQRFRRGLEWLLSDEPAGKPAWPAPPVAKRDGKLVNLVTNGGFEDGMKGWTVAEGDLGVRVVTDERAGGMALHLTPGRGGFGVLEQHFELPPGRTLTATVRYCGRGVNAAAVNIWLHGADHKPIHSDPSLVSESGDENWRPARRLWSTKGAVRATVDVRLINRGEMWLDEVVVTVDG